ncbi:MAG: 6-phosphofructokinase [Oscillospiraceae bacterium]|nr:6-phosphofructokinase [Oscillospiraceae bacterium]
MKTIKRIGVLTSGGDAPGMNPVIRAIVRTAMAEGISVIGIKRGYAGLINGDVQELKNSDVDGLTLKGGTILYTARCDEFLDPAYREKAAKTCKYLGLDGVIAIGGDGTFRGAVELSKLGVQVAGIPATIDNDMGCTEYTIGFDTACNTILDAIDKLRDTGQSHERVSVVEVMGRHAGHLALYSGIAAGASAVLLPEQEVDFEHDVAEIIRRGAIRGRRHHIVVIAEGVGHATDYTRRIEEATGIESRVTVLGYIQRGGVPSARDRSTAAMMGVRALDIFKEGDESRAVIVKGGCITDMPLADTTDMKRALDETMFRSCNRIDTSYYWNK